MSQVGDKNKKEKEEPHAKIQPHEISKHLECCLHQELLERETMVLSPQFRLKMFISSPDNLV